MKNLRWLALFAILALSLVFPFLVTDPTITSLAVVVLLLCAAATAWNIFSGYTGYISLGHATYFGLGAYTMAIACQDWNVQGGYLPFLIVPLAGFVVACFSLPLGWMALQTRRHIFMVITLAIFYFFQTLASNLSGLTGGSQGMFLPNPPWDVDFINVPFYYVALVLLLLAIIVAWWVRISKFGLGLLAIREDEDRALGLGVKTKWYKLIAYLLSALFVGMVGALTVYFNGSVSPDTSFSQSFNVLIALIVILGGSGTIVGPFVGGLILVPVQQILFQQLGSTTLQPVLNGGVLLIFILLLPRGIVPALRNRWQVQMTENIGEQDDDTLIITELPLEPVSSTAPQRTYTVASSESGGDSFVFEDWLKQISRPLPFSTRLPIPATTRAMQRVKAQRLLPIVYPEANLLMSAEEAASPLTAKKQGESPANVSWRCPICQKPLLLKGNACYCPRCGIIRPLSEGRQTHTFLKD